MSGTLAVLHRARKPSRADVLHYALLMSG